MLKSLWPLKKKIIRVSTMGFPRSGKNHFLYQLLVEFQDKLPSAHVNLTIRPTQFNGGIYNFMSASVFFDKNKDALLQKGIGATDSVNDDSSYAPSGKINIYEAKYTYKGKEYIFQFLNAPGNYYKDSEQVSILGKVRPKYFDTLLNYGTTGEEDEVIQELLDSDDTMEPDRAKHMYYTHLFNINADFSFQLIDDTYYDPDLRGIKVAKILSKFDLYVKFDEVHFQMKNEDFKEIYFKKCKELYEKANLLKMFKTSPDSKRKILPKLKFDLQPSKDFPNTYGNIIPTVFFIFPNHSHTNVRVLNDPHYETIDGETFVLSNEILSKLPREEFPNLYNGNKLGNFFESYRESLGYDIALYFMLNQLDIPYGKLKTNGTIGTNVSYWEDFLRTFKTTKD